jgi:hypothetical protein
MNIGLDVSSIAYQRGVSRYTSNLMLALLEQPNVHLLLYGNSFRNYDQFLSTLIHQLGQVKLDRYQFFLGKTPPRVLAKLWQLGLQPIKKTMPQVEVFHSWDWLQPPDKDLPLVSTILIFHA